MYYDSRRSREARDISLSYNLIFTNYTFYRIWITFPPLFENSYNVIIIFINDKNIYLSLYIDILQWILIIWIILFTINYKLFLKNFLKLRYIKFLFHKITLSWTLIIKSTNILNASLRFQSFEIITIKRYTFTIIYTWNKCTIRQRNEISIVENIRKSLSATLDRSDG